MNKELYETVILYINLQFGDGDYIEPGDKQACAEMIVEALEKAGYRKADEVRKEVLQGVDNLAAQCGLDEFSAVHLRKYAKQLGVRGGRMKREKEVEALKLIIAENMAKYSKAGMPYEEALKMCALGILASGFGKVDELNAEIAGLTGKCEALQKDNENLTRTLEEGRDYKYCDSCVECELQDICKYSENYNFCEDCKEYPDCTIMGYDNLPCGRNVECNNGFEEKSIFDDEDEEDEE